MPCVVLVMALHDSLRARFFIHNSGIGTLDAE